MCGSRLRGGGGGHWRARNGCDHPPFPPRPSRPGLLWFLSSNGGLWLRRRLLALCDRLEAAAGRERARLPVETHFAGYKSV